MAGAKLVVLYPPPKDVAAFEKVYMEEHVPMAVQKLGGKSKIVASKSVESPLGKPAFHRYVDADIIYFQFSGTTTLETEFGVYEMTPGEVLLVPGGISHTLPGSTAMSLESTTPSSTVIGLPLTSRMAESCVRARLSSTQGSRTTAMSDSPQNCLGRRTLG